MTPTEVRLRLHEAGYQPIPCRGKNPGMMKKWAWQLLGDAKPEHITTWGKVFPDAPNTGLLTAHTPAFDIDVKIEEPARAIEDMVRERVEERGHVLVRFGLPPKRLIPFRTDAPFKKITRIYTAPDGSEHKFEFLGLNQQFVAFGIHPDTHKPYEWFGGEPGQIPHDDLPYINEAEAHQLIDAAERILIEQFGFKRTGFPSNGAGGERHPSDDPQADDERLARALDAIPNTTDWDGWNTMGMAIWRATGGNGSALFDRWSQKSPKYDGPNTVKRWEHYARSPPNSIGAGTIFHLADQHDPNWRIGEPPPGPEPPPWEPPPDPPPGSNPTEPSPQTGVRPVDLWGKFTPPPLPCGLLPKTIEDFAVQQGELMGADPAGLAMGALTVCGAAIKDAIQLQVKTYDRSWMESARIWVCLIGQPSTKKSPIMTEAARPLIRIDMELFRRYLDALARYNELDKEERRGREPPPQVRLRLEDTTIEAAQEILKDSPGGVLCLQDELSGFFGSMDKYSGHRGAAKDRGFWLQAWNGGSYAVNRVSRGAGMIPNLSVSLLGGIQPELIRQLAADMLHDGLLQRQFPIVLRPATVGTDAPNPPSRDAYAKLVEKLYTLTPDSISFWGAGTDFNKHLRFDVSAQTIRQELEAKHLALTTVEVLNKKLAAHVGKLDGLFARLCVIWHCVETCDGDIPREITAATTRRVAKFLHGFLVPHMMSFYSRVLALADDHERLAAVAGHILAHGLKRVTNRDIQRGDRTMRRLNRIQTEEVFEQLEALGWLARTPGRRKTDSPQWVVNPQCHKLFADRAKMEAERRCAVRDVIREYVDASPLNSVTE